MGCGHFCCRLEWGLEAVLRDKYQVSLEQLPSNLPEALVPLNGETVLSRLVKQLKRLGAIEVFAGVGKIGSEANPDLLKRLREERGFHTPEGGPWTPELWKYMRGLPCHLVEVPDFGKCSIYDTIYRILQEILASNIDFQEIILFNGDYVFTDDALEYVLSQPVPSIYFPQWLEFVLLFSHREAPFVLEKIQQYRGRSAGPVLSRILYGAKNYQDADCLRKKWNGLNRAFKS